MKKMPTHNKPPKDIFTVHEKKKPSHQCDKAKPIDKLHMRGKSTNEK